MRLRAHRRNLVSWSPSAGPADRYDAPRLARARRIRAYEGKRGGLPHCPMHMPVLRLYVFVRLLYDLLKDRQFYIAKPFDVHTDPARRMFAQASQQFRVAYRSVHKINSYLIFPWVKAHSWTIAFTATVILEVIGIKPDGAHIPYLWLTPAYSLHHFDQRLGIFYALLIIE